MGDLGRVSRHYKLFYKIAQGWIRLSDGSPSMVSDDGHVSYFNI